MTQEGPQPSAEFVELVRDSLVHLYEPAHLARHPLGALLTDTLPPLGDQAQSLRLFLLDAIERLEPVGAERSSEKARRPYTVLVQRYVAGLDVGSIGAAFTSARASSAASIRRGSRPWQPTCGRSAASAARWRRTAPAPA